MRCRRHGDLRKQVVGYPTLLHDWGILHELLHGVRVEALVVPDGVHGVTLGVEPEQRERGHSLPAADGALLAAVNGSVGVVRPLRPLRGLDRNISV